MWKWSDLKRIWMRKASTRDVADLGAVMWPVQIPPLMQDAYDFKDPHVTVVIFNDINNPELGYTRQDVMEAVRATLWDVFVYMNVDGLEWFGENQDVPVLRVSHDYLEAYRNALMFELEARGIPVDMTFPDYKPHVTVPDEFALDIAAAGVNPSKLLAGPVEVWWAKEHYRVDTGERVG